MKLKRFLKKSLFALGKMTISFLVYFDHRLYMRLYNPLLKFSGIHLRGSPRFIAKSVRFDDMHLITLGDRLIVSMNVVFLTHDYSLTTALISIGEHQDKDIAVLKPITVGDNVFIGMNTILLPGTHIEDNVIVGAGSVVRGRIPAFSIISGNPASIIGDTRTQAAKVKERKDVNLRRQ